MIDSKLPNKKGLDMKDSINVNMNKKINWRAQE